MVDILYGDGYKTTGKPHGGGGKNNRGTMNAAAEEWKRKKKNHGKNHDSV